MMGVDSDPSHQACIRDTQAFVQPIDHCQIQASEAFAT